MFVSFSVKLELPSAAQQSGQCRDITSRVRHGDKVSSEVLKMGMKSTVGKKNIISRYMSDWKFTGVVSCVLPKIISKVLDFFLFSQNGKKSPEPNPAAKQNKNTP